MRCLIYAKSTDSLWVKEYFPDVEPYLLKIVNKPLLEYYLDLVSLLGVTDLRIVSDSSIKAIEQYFTDGAKWGINISYSLARPEDSLENVYLKNYSFCKDVDMLLWDGFYFVQYDRNTVKQSMDFSKAFCCETALHRMIYLPSGEKLRKQTVFDTEHSSCLMIREINSVVEYYKLSMEILTLRNKAYVLPGYSNEKDTFIGLNLVYPNSCELNAPIMIGNNCRFQRDTIIGPNSIFGSNIIVDENTSVKDSIIYDNTYLGGDLDLHQKIVYKSHLISATSGEQINITDRVLVSQVDLGVVTSYFNRLVQSIIGLLLLVMMFIPWLLLYVPFMAIYKKRKTERLMSKNMNGRVFEDPSLIKMSFWGKIMLRLSLDKFTQLYVAVFTRKLYLVGNHLFTNTVAHRKLISELPVYNPGVFSLIESVGAEGPDVEQFYELEFIENVSTRYIIGILCASLLRRLIHG